MRINALKTWLLLGLMAPLGLLAQKEVTEKPKEKKDVQQIIITRNGGKTDKIVVEINNDKVTINGKPLEEFKEEDIKVKLNNLKDVEALTFSSPGRGAWTFSGSDNNRAMLGVGTEKDEKGARIMSVTDETAAEKIGLKEGDIITKMGDTKIETPDDLTAFIGKHKPGDKVSVTWLRDGKEQKATAELGKWRWNGMNLSGTGPMEFRMDDFNRDFKVMIPKMQELQKLREFSGPGQSWSWSGNSPKLGLSVQDTDEGKGVKVIEVEEESSAAKAGIKTGDIITDVEGKAVNSTDDIVKLMKESKDKPSVMVKLQRAGKTQHIEVRMPRKIKTAEL